MPYKFKEDRDKHWARYYSEHKIKIIAKVKRWYRSHKEHRKEYMRRYKEEHVEEIAALNHRCYENNKPERLARNKTWRNNNRERVRETDRKYAKTSLKFKAAQRRYRDSHKEQIRAYQRRRYAKNPEKGLIKVHRRHRLLLTDLPILGRRLDGLEMNLHHVTPRAAVWIPAKLNRSVRHSIINNYGMETINPIAMLFYESCDPTIGLNSSTLTT